MNRKLLLKNARLHAPVSQVVNGVTPTDVINLEIQRFTLFKKGKRVSQRIDGKWVYSHKRS